MPFQPKHFKIAMSKFNHFEARMSAVNTFISRKKKLLFFSNHFECEILRMTASFVNVCLSWIQDQIAEQTLLSNGTQYRYIENTRNILDHSHRHNTSHDDSFYPHPSFTRDAPFAPLTSAIFENCVQLMNFNLSNSIQQVNIPRRKIERDIKQKWDSFKTNDILIMESDRGIR